MNSGLSEEIVNRGRDYSPAVGTPRVTTAGVRKYMGGLSNDCCFGSAVAPCFSFRLSTFITRILISVIFVLLIVCHSNFTSSSRLLSQNIYIFTFQTLIQSYLCLVIVVRVFGILLFLTLIFRIFITSAFLSLIHLISFNYPRCNNNN